MKIIFKIEDEIFSIREFIYTKFDNTRTNINANLYEIYEKIKSTVLETDNLKDYKNNIIVYLNDIKHYLFNFKKWENYSENEIDMEINYIKQNFYLDNYFTDDKDEKIANAILDRLVHHSTIFNINGKSSRMHESLINSIDNESGNGENNLTFIIYLIK